MRTKLPAQSSGSSAESPSSAEPPISGPPDPLFRDFLAVHAMAALIGLATNKSFDVETYGGQMSNAGFRAGIAREAYAFADALIAERGR